MSEKVKGIIVRYTKDGKTLQCFIEEQVLLLPENVLYEEVKDCLIKAAKELLVDQCGPDGEFEVVENLTWNTAEEPKKTVINLAYLTEGEEAPEGSFPVVPIEPDSNIPHAARTVSQFSLEERDGKPVMRGTGKVMCWCNCGEMTGWLDAYTEMTEVSVFLTAHEPAEEIGVRLHYSLGEIAGYVIETEDSVSGAVTHLVHKCGWSQDIRDFEHPLTDIVMTAMNNKHVCINQEQKS